ncbi:MAG TPA: radical SAM protein [Acidobacteriota bacterium]|nr:radical SAM protein [Acidobacteriota bacterium]
MMIAHGLATTRHPILAHIVPMRRCNLSCTYCNEYDDFSPPVPAPLMLQRVDRLAGLGLSVLVISGGEPLLHPQLDNIIARSRRHGMLTGLISNGYLLTVDRIKRLNAAGLDHLQISIDNILPDEVSKKSLKVLDKKLQMLSEYAHFEVNVNSVIGGGIKNAEDATMVNRRAVELGLMSTVGIIHNGKGQLKPLSEKEQQIYRQLRDKGKRSWTRFYKFQDDIAEAKPHNWSCRSGSRYLYICEDGLVHYCSQQRGYPGIPLADYTRDHIRREFDTKKYCAPYCTVACVHVISCFDNWRGPQTQRAFYPVKPAPERASEKEPESVAPLADLPPAFD